MTDEAKRLSDADAELMKEFRYTILCHQPGGERRAHLEAVADLIERLSASTERPTQMEGITKAALEVLEWYNKDGSAGGAVWPMENLGRALRAFASQPSGVSAEAAEVAAGSADDIRALGWVVAVHNDYRLNGEPHTFWLFTNGDRAIKGEGQTDAEALNAIRRSLPIQQSAMKENENA